MADVFMGSIAVTASQCVSTSTPRAAPLKYMRFKSASYTPRNLGGGTRPSAPCQARSDTPDHAPTGVPGGADSLSPLQPFPLRVPRPQSPVPAFQYGDPSAFEPLCSSTLPRDSIAALGAAPQTPSPAPRAQPGTSSVAGHRRGLPATRQPSHVSCPQSLSCSCDGFDQLFLSGRRV